ncbi:hypothetical protein PP713_13855 [Mycobacterium sp. CSUR Q5927]|nr:hypothetical protein [Mycobacterium sp. CSUR Q5927]
MDMTIIPPPTDTEGWLLETRGKGDGIVYHATTYGGQIIATAIKRDGRWYLGLCDGKTRGLASFSSEETALAWLEYVAELNTRRAA